MTQEAQDTNRSARIGAFAEQLDKVYESVGRPELDVLASIAEDRGSVPLLPSTVEEHLRGESAPSWEFVVTFVDACESYAVDRGLDLPKGQFSLKWWRGQYDDMLEGLSAGRSAPVTAPDEPGPSRSLSTLPPTPPGFSGRHTELGRLRSLIADTASRPWLIVIHGVPGIGKTTLATAWVHEITAQFPDGCHFVSVGPAGDGEVFSDRLGQLLRNIGVPETNLPESAGDRLALLGSRLRRQRLLLVLDDVPDTAMIEALRPGPGEPRSLVVVTSRSDLGDGADLGARAAVRLQPLAELDAWALLCTLVPADRLDADASALHGMPRELVGNPLTLRLLAGMLQSRTQTSLRQLLDSLVHDRGTGLGELLQRSYDSLSETAAMVLRRLSLVDEYEEIPRQLVGFLAGDLAPGVILGAFDELAAAGLIIASPDGEVIRLAHSAVREFAEGRVRAQDSEDEAIAVRDRARRFFLLSRGYRPQPERSIARDAYTLDDRLSYSHYAAAIAEFIRHRQTRPPLTIGLKAPWGAGKTSLMRMIQNILDPRDGDEPCRIRLDGASSSRRVTNREILREAGTVTADDPVRLRSHLAEGAPLQEREWRPTVWFNPWMYQNGEQIWAGLAHEIITQVTERLPVADRERFWLKLNLARVDRSVIRRRWHRLLAERLLPFVLFWLLTIVVTLVGLAVAQLVDPWRETIRNVSAAGLGGGTVALLAAGARQGFNFLGKTATGPLSMLVNRSDVLGGGQRLLAAEMKKGFDQLVPDPGYAGRLGFLHLVQTDMKRVLDLIATPRRPLVVFVDDLDRCSPSAVTQVIEAINLFLAGEFPHCVFVLGMEPGTVAAHVEVAYQDLVKAQRDGRLAGDWSTLGWRFLEKIVQLPLSIPPPRGADELAGYLRSLVTTGVPPTADAPRATAASRSQGGRDGAEGATVPPVPSARQTPADSRASGWALDRPDPADVDAVERDLRARRPTPDTLRSVALAAQFEVLGLPEPLCPAALAAADRVISDLYSDVDAHAALADLLPVLDSRNPREIKRFVNLFRFYSFIAERQRLLGAPMPEQEQIAKLAAFAIRWPHVISMLGASDTDGVLGTLERAARAGAPERWSTELRRTFPVFVAAPDGAPVDTPAPGWGDDLRAFLREGVEIAAVASRFV
ncbi:P-loop NTPase fold protein [Streptomyces sp. NBC_01613]|uniref:P-loop NTPase fold protein n=1 Tax=Streptomyces sp. NBC_01613 TaxID=2975896 RepID=UPI0038704585